MDYLIHLMRIRTKPTCLLTLVITNFLRVRVWDCIFIDKE